MLESSYLELNGCGFFFHSRFLRIFWVTKSLFNNVKKMSENMCARADSRLAECVLHATEFNVANIRIWFPENRLQLECRWTCNRQARYNIGIIYADRQIEQEVGWWNDRIKLYFVTVLLALKPSSQYHHLSISSPCPRSSNIDYTSYRCTRELFLYYFITRFLG